MSQADVATPRPSGLCARNQSIAPPPTATPRAVNIRSRGLEKLGAHGTPSRTMTSNAPMSARSFRCE
ncbi:MAG TPA: hypothetical protein VMT68_03265 [Caulobacteraceae bacterium]|nr:hypothetical protein [Caulobacteraceae bacterium]